VNAGTCRQSRQLRSTTGVVLAWGRSRPRRCTLFRDHRAQPGRGTSQSSALNRPGLPPGQGGSRAQLWREGTVLSSRYEYIGEQKESSDVSLSVGASLRHRANLRAGPRIAA
jgi:hypothetical protein